MANPFEETGPNPFEEESTNPFDEDEDDICIPQLDDELGNLIQSLYLIKLCFDDVHIFHDHFQILLYRIPLPQSPKS